MVKAKLRQNRERSLMKFSELKITELTNVLLWVNGFSENTLPLKNTDICSARFEEIEELADAATLTGTQSIQLIRVNESEYFHVMTPDNYTALDDFCVLLLGADVILTEWHTLALLTWVRAEVSHEGLWQRCCSFHLQGCILGFKGSSYDIPPSGIPDPVFEDEVAWETYMGFAAQVANIIAERMKVIPAVSMDEDDFIHWVSQLLAKRSFEENGFSSLEEACQFVNLQLNNASFL